MPNPLLPAFLRVALIIVLALGAPLAMAWSQSRAGSAALAARAVETGDEALLERELKAGVDPNLAPGGVPWLHVAAARGDIAGIRLLLRHGAEVNRCDLIRRTALHAAAGAGQADAARELLRAGADPNARATRGRTPLYFAATAGQHSVAALLLQHGADPDIALSAGPAGGACPESLRSAGWR